MHTFLDRWFFMLLPALARQLHLINDTLMILHSINAILEVNKTNAKRVRL